MAILRVSNPPSNHWLIGATLAGYLLIAFILRFWGEGLLLPANDIGYVNAPPPESHLGVILLVLVGVFVTLLGGLQSVFSIQLSEKMTRFSLWLNFLAVLCFGLDGFGAKYTVFPLHFLVLSVSVLAFPLGLVLSVVNILWGWLRRKGLRNVGPRG
ncbi:MAG: hypothetical protein ABSG16_24615 [Candidatus Acidiferrum sp.]